jgi:hypothetical protein
MAKSQLVASVYASGSHAESTAEPETSMARARRVKTRESFRSVAGPGGTASLTISDPSQHSPVADSVENVDHGHEGSHLHRDADCTLLSHPDLHTLKSSSPAIMIASSVDQSVELATARWAWHAHERCSPSDILLTSARSMSCNSLPSRAFRCAALNAFHRCQPNSWRIETCGPSIHDLRRIAR